MGKYGQFCPVAMAAEIFAERWTPLIVRELFCGSHRFSELEHGLPNISSALLVQRLRVLERAGVVERRTGEKSRVTEYHLTKAGLELAEIVFALGEWGRSWVSTEAQYANLDPDLLMWDVHRRLHRDRLPSERVVIRFDFSGAAVKSYWLVIDHGDVSICWGDPGFDVDLHVAVDTLAFHRVWMGHLPIADAIRDELVRIDGPSELARAFPGWLALSLFAPRESPEERRLPSAALQPPTPAGRHRLGS